MRAPSMASSVTRGLAALRRKEDAKSKFDQALLRLSSLKFATDSDKAFRADGGPLEAASARMGGDDT